MNILQVKNEKGEWVSIPAIQGLPGKDATINGVNALTIEAGENVTITQKDDTLTINAAGGGSGGEIYSTEETRIGTWIDGKPLYRKVIVGGPYSAEQRPTLLEIPEVDFSAVQFQTYVREDGYQLYSSGLDYIVAGNAGGLSVYREGQNLKVYVKKDPIKVAYFLFIYTKTTDAATIAVTNLSAPYVNASTQTLSMPTSGALASTISMATTASIQPSQF